MTSSTGWSGLIFLGSPPIRFMASRIAARSTTAGTPVKSWSRTRLGRKAISRLGIALGSHSARPRMSSFVTVTSSSLRSRFSRRILSENGRRARSTPCVGEGFEAMVAVGLIANLEGGQGVEAIGHGMRASEKSRRRGFGPAKGTFYRVRAGRANNPAKIDDEARAFPSADRLLVDGTYGPGLSQVDRPGLHAVLDRRGQDGSGEDHPDLDG